MSHKRRKNQKITSAADPRLVAPQLDAFRKSPEQIRQEKEIGEMLNTATRAGAGGTKAGLVGLRPQGLKRANDIVDLITPGRFKEKPKPFEQELKPINDDGAAACPFKLVIMLPRSFCVDCGRNDRPHEGGAINPSFWTEERPDLGVKALDAMINFICQECCKAWKEKQHDPAQQIITMSVHGAVSQKQQREAERLVRCKKNGEDYIRANRHNPDIYIDGIDGWGEKVG